jgi:tetratricopeptide (TPR) repeat protein
MGQLAWQAQMPGEKTVSLESIRGIWKWGWSRFYRRLADAHRHFGNLYGNRMEHWAAVKNYTRATVLDPTYAQAFYSRGVLSWRELGDYPQAIQDLTRVLELVPTWAEAYFNRGMAHKLRNEVGQAVDDFQRYMAEGTDEFWLEAARRQVDELQDVHAADQTANGPETFG